MRPRLPTTIDEPSIFPLHQVRPLSSLLTYFPPSLLSYTHSFIAGQHIDVTDTDQPALQVYREEESFV